MVHASRLVWVSRIEPDGDFERSDACLGSAREHQRRAADAVRIGEVWTEGKSAVNISQRALVIGAHTQCHVKSGTGLGVGWVARDGAASKGLGRREAFVWTTRAVNGS